MRARSFVTGSCLIGFLASCGPKQAPVPPTTEADDTQSEPFAAAPSNQAAPKNGANEPQPAKSEEPSGKLEQKPVAKEPPFRPPDFDPPFEETRKEGDGKWVPLGSSERGELAGKKPAVVYTTTIHPHPKSPYQSITLAAIDLERTRVHFVPGTDDFGVAKVKDEVDLGLVPKAEQDRLVAVFNGGFQARHGYWGVMLHGKELLKPRDIGCTLLIEKDGRIRMGSWTALGDTSQAEAVRQTPPCLVEDGKIQPLLERHQDRMWAGHNPDRKTRRRSAVGIDATGRILYYGVGTEVDPLHLAQGMRFAGARTAAQFDINWNWTRFLLFGKKETGAPVRALSSLAEQMKYGSRSYVDHAQQRDFFYVLLRQPEH